MNKTRLMLAAAAFAMTVPADAALPAGAPAPDFTAQATLGGKPFTFHLADALRKGPVVLYFYPAAFTHGCTVEAHAFAEATESFEAMGATLIGVSVDPIEKLNRFSVEACSSKFAVGSIDHKLAARYKATLPLIGRSNRTSYVIAPDGHILLAFSALSPKGHVENTLAAVRAWRAAHPST